MSFSMRRITVIMSSIRQYQRDFVRKFMHIHNIKEVPPISLKLIRSVETLSHYDGYYTENGPLDLETAKTLDGAFCQISFSVYWLSLISEDDLREVVLQGLGSYLASVLIINNRQGSVTMPQLIDRCIRDFGYEPKHDWIPKTLVRYMEPVAAN